MLPYVVVTALAVAVLLAAEATQTRALAWIAKPTASTAFVAAACARGLPHGGYGRAVLVALVLSWWGDVLLIPKSQRIFRAGILAFLSAHLAYGVAFALRGISPAWLLASLLPIGALGVPLGRYFARHAPAALKGAVIAYVAVLSTMVALAIGALGAGAPKLLAIAAVAFYVSDLSVALNRFVRPSLLTRAWGAPLYFGAQLAFAATAVNAIG